MKRLLVVTILLSTALTAQVTHVKFIQDGAFASISEPTGPDSAFSLNVSLNDTNSVTTANISFTSSSISTDPVTGDTIVAFTNVIGAIPAADFSAQNTQNMTLNFSTADLDPNNSISQSCTLDLSTFNFTCGPAPAGTINLSFSEDGGTRTQVLALEQVVTLGNVTTRTHQKSDNGSATAQGNVFGTAVVGGSATVGINRSSSIEATVQ